MRYSSLIIASLVATTLSASATEPDSSSKWLDEPLPAAWNVPDSTSGPIATSDRWWAGFHDTLLDTLITRGREANYDLASAAARIKMAQAQLGQARAGYYPTVGVAASYTRTRMSGRTTSHDMDATVESYFSGTATMSWEIDVFGKVTAQVRSGKAQVRVSAAEYAAALNSLEAQIATTYVTLLADREQLEVARRHSESQQHILNAAEERFEAGLNSKLDVAQARTLYYSTIASIPMLEAEIESCVNALAVLLGTTAEGLPAGVGEQRPLPDFRQYADLGTPSELLRRRPDVVEAERNIDLAAAALGIAKKEYLPSLSLQASVGTAAHRFEDLFSRPSFTYSIAPTLSWTVFDGLSRRYGRIEAEERLHAAVDAYNMAVLNAVEEVRSAATRYASCLRYIESIEKVVDNAAESTTLSFDLYRQGLSSFTNVDDAESSYLTYENTQVTAHAEALTALIDLFKALGGAPLD